MNSQHQSHGATSERRCKTLAYSHEKTRDIGHGFDHQRKRVLRSEPGFSEASGQGRGRRLDASSLVNRTQQQQSKHTSRARGQDGHAEREPSRRHRSTLGAHGSKFIAEGRVGGTVGAAGVHDQDPFLGIRMPIRYRPLGARSNRLGHPSWPSRSTRNHQLNCIKPHCSCTTSGHEASWSH